MADDALVSGGERPSRMRLPLALALVAVVALLVAYWAYVRTRTAYFVSRDLRVLSTFAGQIDSTFDVLSGFVRNFAWHMPRETAIVIHGSQSNITDLKPSDLLPGFEGGRTPCDAPSFVARGAIDSYGDAKPANVLRYIEERVPTAEAIERTFVTSAGVSWMRIAYAGVRADPTGHRDLTPNPAAFEPPKVADGQRQLRRACGEIALSNAISPLIGQSFLRAFDAVMIVDAKTGDVIYAARPSRGKEITPADVGVTNVAVMRERTGWREYTALSATTLAQQTREIDVDLAGDSYKLFTRPYIFAAGGGEEKDDKKDDKVKQATAEPMTRWIVCGLVAQDRFGSQLRTISASRVAIIVSILVLAVCWWPFLRIWLSDEHQALTITDAISTIFSAVILTAILTLIFVDSVGYRQLSQVADHQLRDFAASLQQDISTDLLRAARAMHATKRWSEKHVWTDWQLANFGTEAKGELLEESDIAGFPYMQQIAWMDASGNQIYKASKSGKAPRVSVAARSYFIDAMAGRTWHIPGRRAGEEGYDVTFESVRSMTTGKPQAIMAMRTGRPLPVLAMAFDLVAVMHAVPPAGVKFAIIDDDGEVIFHSEQERSGVERFFSEIDDARSLRSAILARRDRHVTTPYWGEDQSLYVRPLNGTPWSLVTFRQKSLLRAVNIETLVITVLLLLLGAGLYLIIFLIIVLRMPRYRAPAIWPDRKRAEDYAHLIVAYGLAAAALGSCIYALSPDSLLFVLYIAPAQTLLSTYLLLHNRRRSWMYAFVAVGWMVITGLYIWLICDASIGEHLAVSCTPRLTKALLLLFLVLESVTALGYFIGRESTMLRELVKRVRYPFSYRVSGVLLLIISAALPTIGHFKIACWLELETLVKYAERDLIAKLEQRLEGVAVEAFVTMKDLENGRDTILSRLQRDCLPRQFGYVFAGTGCTTLDRVADCGSCEQGSPPVVPDPLAMLFPQYSDESVGMRELYGGEASDHGWRACRRGRMVTVDEAVDIPPARLQLFQSSTGEHQGEARFVVTAEVPLLFPTMFTPETIRRGFYMTPSTANSGSLINNWTATLGAVILLVAFLMLLFWIVDFIATRIFLLDIAEPLWLGNPPLSPTLGDHIFLVRRTKSADELAKGTLVAFADVSFKEMAANDGWLAKIVELDRLPEGRNVRIVDFEYEIADKAMNEKRLRFLEDLLRLPDRLIVILSTVTPLLVVTIADALPGAYAKKEPAELPEDVPADALPAAVKPPAQAARWRVVLESFVWVTEEHLALRAKLAARERESDPPPPPVKSEHPWKDFFLGLKRLPQTAVERYVIWRRDTIGLFRVKTDKDDRNWLREETQYDPFLRELKREMIQATPARLNLSSGQRRRQLLDEILERGHAYYSGLWQSCSSKEKMLLYELALHGLINGKDRRTVRRLIARGLVRRDGNLKLFSETFRLHVLREGREEHVDAMQKALPSRWNEVRLPLLIVFLSVAVLVFGTQKDLKDVTTAVVTGLTTGIPLIIKLLGVFTERRLQSAQGPQ
ncbi:MAG: hypothetical protein QOI24_4694 [Acidobacteriota bacterium]|jgi:hypothetical protein|nr:hypothetical protein [Acidobacteriota bacterium]